MEQKETLILSIIKNQHDEFQIQRDGGALKTFEANTMDSQMVLKYGINLGHHIADKEKRPVKVVDNFTTKTPCCSKCGGIDVEGKVWQNFKNGSLTSISSDEEDVYCNTCEDHISLDEKEIDAKIGIEILSVD